MQIAANKIIGIFNLFRRRAALPAQSEAGTLASTAATPAFTERRQAPRRWGDPVQVFISDGSPGTAAVRGWIVNRSAGGLGLSASQPALEGALLSVRITIAPDTFPWTLLQVKSCIPSTGRWILGCQFVETPPREVLLMFR